MRNANESILFESRSMASGRSTRLSGDAKKLPIQIKSAKVIPGPSWTLSNSSNVSSYIESTPLVNSAII